MIGEMGVFANSRKRKVSLKSHWVFCWASFLDGWDGSKREVLFSWKMGVLLSSSQDDSNFSLNTNVNNRLEIWSSVAAAETMESP